MRVWRALHKGAQVRGRVHAHGPPPKHNVERSGYAQRTQLYPQAFYAHVRRNTNSHGARNGGRNDSAVGSRYGMDGEDARERRRKIQQRMRMVKL
jgi:hypothetical protein